MSKHSLEASNFNRQYFTATAIVERERQQMAATAETSIIPADIVSAADLGQTTIEAFKVIAENFEVKKPSLKERFSRFGRNILNVIKSVRFESATETRKPLYTDAEKQDMFAADRVNAIVRARTNVDAAFAPINPGVVEGRVARTDQSDTPEGIADEDSVIKAQNKVLHGISYQEQEEYADILEKEREDLQSAPDSARIRLLTHDGPTATTAILPMPDRLKDFQKQLQQRSAADAAMYAARGIAVGSNGIYNTHAELYAKTQ